MNKISNTPNTNYISPFFVLLVVFFLVSIFSNIFLILKNINVIISLIMLMLYICLNLNVKFNNKILLLITGVFTFQMIFILYGLLQNNNIQNIITVSKYLLMFMIFPIVYYLVQKNYLSNIVEAFAKIVLIKIIVIVFLSGFIIFFPSLKIMFFDFLYNYTELTPFYPTGTFLRMFDSYAVFFPLAFIYLNKKSNLLKFYLHILIFTYIVIVGSIGILMTYVIILTLINKKFFYYIILFSSLIYLSFFDLINNIVDAKMYSILVKETQLEYVFDGLTLFGVGAGYEFHIGDRSGILLENLFLYFLHSYGIVGFIFHFSFFVFVPLLIIFKYRYNINLYFIGLSYIAILFSSLSNPYLMSGSSILFILILYSAYLSSYKTNNLNYIT